MAAPLRASRRASCWFRRLSPTICVFNSSCRSCKALLLAGTTPTVDGDPRTSEPPCRERLIEIDGFVGHGRAPHKRVGFRLEGPRVEGSEGKRVSGLGRSIPCNIAKQLRGLYLLDLILSGRSIRRAAQRQYRHYTGGLFHLSQRSWQGAFALGNVSSFPTDAPWSFVGRAG